MNRLERLFFIFLLLWVFLGLSYWRSPSYLSFFTQSKIFTEIIAPNLDLVFQESSQDGLSNYAATLRKSQGEIRYTPPTSLSGMRAKINQRFKRRTLVETFHNGRGELRLVNGSQLILDPNSSVLLEYSIKENSEGQILKEPKLTLKKGNIVVKFSKNPELSSPVEIEANGKTYLLRQKEPATAQSEALPQEQKKESKFIEKEIKEDVKIEIKDETKKDVASETKTEAKEEPKKEALKEATPPVIPDKTEEFSIRISLREEAPLPLESQGRKIASLSSEVLHFEVEDPQKKDLSVVVIKDNGKAIAPALVPLEESPQTLPENSAEIHEDLKNLSPEKIEAPPPPVYTLPETKKVESPLGLREDSNDEEAVEEKESIEAPLVYPPSLFDENYSVGSVHKVQIDDLVTLEAPFQEMDPNQNFYLDWDHDFYASTPKTWGPEKTADSPNSPSYFHLDFSIKDLFTKLDILDTSTLSQASILSSKHFEFALNFSHAHNKNTESYLGAQFDFAQWSSINPVGTKTLGTSSSTRKGIELGLKSQWTERIQFHVLVAYREEFFIRATNSTVFQVESQFVPQIGVDLNYDLFKITSMDFGIDPQWTYYLPSSSLSYSIASGMKWGGALYIRRYFSWGALELDAGLSKKSQDTSISRQSQENLYIEFKFKFQNF